MEKPRNNKNREQEDMREEDFYGESGGSSSGTNPQPRKKDYTKAIVIFIIVLAIASVILTMS